MTTVSKLLQGATALIASLPQWRTNGDSDLGTFNATTLASFLTNNPIVNGYPWGPKSPWNADPYKDGPNTGVTRSYELTIARGTVAPDGYSRDILLVNGQYPGPLIEANWGDTFQITVKNEISGPEEGTAMHWHGINQQGTEWADGVPTVSMCPVAPGSSYTHNFKATPYGTTWYHSHYSAQYVGGLWGPLVIHGPQNDAYDEDLGPITLNDYFHRDYFDILTDVMGTDFSKARPASDNNLINGKMNFDCGKNAGNSTTEKCVNNAGLSKFSFKSGKRYRLRLINTGVQGIQKFSIDNHIMTVIANDFIPIESYNTTIVTLGIGQRSDVIVEATGKSTDIVWMRSKLASGSCTEPVNQPLALATIYYEHANTTAAPVPSNSTAQVDNTDPCNNDDLSKTVPNYPIAAGEPSTTYTMNVNISVNATGHLQWTINDSMFRGDYNNPVLLLAKTGNDSYPLDPQWNVYNFGTNDTIRIIVQNISPTSHPWHLHGHEMQVLASGIGEWDGKVVNAENPQRRDVQMLPAKGYIVLQWASDNPGVWPFHCHIAWHISGGLGAQIMERPADIQKLPIPSTAFENCRTWAAYTGGHIVDQIDSGI